MGRVTSGAAMALLGKIYLTFHKWTEARNVLSQLIGRYSLMPTPDKVFDVDNKMNDEIIFAVRFNKDVEGEGHGYWFSIINLTDDTNQTKALKECYKDGDKRKDLITYVKVEDKVCVMNKFKDLKSATYNTVGNDQIILRYPAPALATAIKRLWPDRLVFTYQGDGDLACIGTAETIHALNRGENITIVFINNAIYGMTGGQMAPTTLVGMKTSTSPYGRDVHLHGYPLKIADIAAQLEGTAYVTRQSVETVPAIRKTKKAIRKAFENSMAGKGSNLVEIVSTCNSGWKMSPEKSNKWMQENMFPFYPLGDLKDK